MTPENETHPIPDPANLQPSEGLSPKVKRWMFLSVFGIVGLVVLINAISGPSPIQPATANKAASLPKQMQGNPTAAELSAYSHNLEQQREMLLDRTWADAANLERIRSNEGQITAADLQKAAALREAAAVQQQYRQSQNDQGLAAQAGQGRTPGNKDRALALDSLVRQEHAQASPILAPWQRPPVTTEVKVLAEDQEEPDAAPTSAGIPGARTAAKSPGATRVRKPLDFDTAVKTFYLPEGTVIEAVITNRLNGDSTGPVNAMLTADVYLPGTRVVVIPQGSRVLGEASKVTVSGQQRLAVAFHRVMVPGVPGYSIPLDVKPPALAQGGETGLHDRVNNHYAQIFGTSLAIGAIGGLAQIGNSQSGLGAYDPSVQFRNGVTQSMAQSSERILDKFLNRLPTIEIRPGTRTRILLTDDLNLPAYTKEDIL